MSKSRKIVGVLHKHGFDVWESPIFSGYEEERITFIEKSAYDTLEGDHERLQVKYHALKNSIKSNVQNTCISDRRKEFETKMNYYLDSLGAGSPSLIEGGVIFKNSARWGYETALNEFQHQTHSTGAK